MKNIFSWSVLTIRKGCRSDSSRRCSRSTLSTTAKSVIPRSHRPPAAMCRPIRISATSWKPQPDASTDSLVSGWTPLYYLNQHFDRKLLMKVFRYSDVGLVTPLRDGMNLVAKEYVAAQDPDNRRTGPVAVCRGGAGADQRPDRQSLRSRRGCRRAGSRAQHAAGGTYRPSFSDAGRDQKMIFITGRRALSRICSIFHRAARRAVCGEDSHLPKLAWFRKRANRR